MDFMRLYKQALRNVILSSFCEHFPNGPLPHSLAFQRFFCEQEKSFVRNQVYGKQ